MRAYNTDVPEQIVILCRSCAKKDKEAGEVRDVILGYDLSLLPYEHLTCDECGRRQGDA